MNKSALLIEYEKVRNQNRKFRKALEEIAAYYDGPVVNSSFDEPGSAQRAREALDKEEVL